MAGYEEIASALGNLEEEAVLAALEAVLEDGGSAEEALAACQKGLEIVGNNFETGHYFIGDLIYGGEIMREAVELLKPMLVQGGGESVGKVVFGTVKGDVHDIGKNVVISLMQASGLEVVDLGVDVAPEKFVSAVRDSGAGIVALSGVLTLSIPSMKATVEALVTAGVREQVKIILGGAPITADVCEIAGADAWTLNPQEGTRICLNWAREQD
jgi:methanogenic corrinoid protein MtbC1